LPGRLSGVKLAKALLTAAIFENEDAVVSWLRGYLMESLAPVTPGHLAAAIASNTDFWGGLPEGKKKLVHRLADSDMVKETFTKYANMVNIETFMQWMAEDRPDLASLIVNWPDTTADAWLQRSLDQVKASFLSSMAPTA